MLGIIYTSLSVVAFLSYYDSYNVLVGNQHNL
jgi:hypothetical protein